MTKTQLSTLNQDYQELDSYIREVSAKGNVTLAAKLKRKLDFIGAKLADNNLAA